MSSDPIEVLRELRQNYGSSWPSSKAGIAALDAALASLSAPKPESAEAVHAAAKYGWERSAWAWEDVEKGLEQFTAPPRPEASAAVDEATRRDAERYRFIAEDHSAAWEEELDAAIDQARGKGGAE